MYMLLVFTDRNVAYGPQHISKALFLMLSHVCVARYVYPLPDRTEDGCSVLIYRLGAMDPACHGYRDMVRTSMTVSTLLGSEEETHVNGIVMVFDFSGFSMAHMRALLDRKAMMTWNKMWQVRG